MGFTPLGRLSAVPKVPSPLPSSTETSPENQLATTRSCRPSRFKSATATVIGVVPDTKSARGANDTVWAGVGLGDSDQKDRAVATRNKRFVRFPVISGLLKASLGSGGGKVGESQNRSQGNP